MLPIKERLNNSQVVRVYRQMIENSDIEIVQNLRQNLIEQAPDHPRTKELQVFFKQRLGE